MIRSFADKRTAAIYHGDRVRNFPQDILSVACRKLDMIRRATDLKDLRVPPGNRLEALQGDRKGFYSIRINDQWRIVFRWHEGDAELVGIVDYH